MRLYSAISRGLWIGFFGFVLCPGFVRAAPAPSSPKIRMDVLQFTNGDRITGQLERMRKKKVFFKTEEVGELKIPWEKILRLQTSGKFAVILIGKKIRYGHHDLVVPQGRIDVTGPNLTVYTLTGPEVYPVKRIAFLVDEKTYRKNVDHIPGVLDGWKGSVTGGASLVESTQTVSTYNSGISLSRGVPSVPWMLPDSRSLLGFTSTYGSISQPNSAPLETNIFHGNLEQDKYLSTNSYLLGQGIFDHNSTQGLTLQQIYGLGGGYTFMKREKQELDVTMILSYTKQQFTGSVPGKNLIGATIANNFFHKFANKILLTEISSITPQFNSPKSYSANFTVGVDMPIYKKLAFSIQVIDSYLNDPSPGFNSNSLQINTGLTYTLP
ncbi:MAG: DUF481 domain-containing protein [Leptospirales bacterium]